MDKKTAMSFAARARMLTHKVVLTLCADGAFHVSIGETKLFGPDECLSWLADNGAK